MSRFAPVLAAALVAAGALPAVAQPGARPAPRREMPASAPITDVRYTLAFTSATAAERAVGVTMRFATRGDGPVLLSLPAWTPGAYEISNFARWVSGFAASADGKMLDWDKLDHDTWRITPRGAGPVTVTFDFSADTLDNAMAWSRDDFLMLNGTNVFLYPEGSGFEWAATVTVETEPGWRVATGMTWREGRTFVASSYHDLVDMPFFVGRFDIDSTRIADRWTRLASYPQGSLAGRAREQVWAQLARMIPPMAAVFGGEVPWTTYTVMQVVDSSFGGASGLEHQNSHVDVVSPAAIGHPFMTTLYAHEIFHAWNVKRLRHADLWPYQYAQEQPTEWLWMSEGITDYYADLALVRGGLVDSTGFLGLTTGKIQEVAAVPAVALEDASLSTWIHPEDGTGYIYYPKGSLAGLMLDILIRDASDNRHALDDVMRRLYRDSYLNGRGFTDAEFWGAVREAANGRPFDELRERYVDGRDPFPWQSLLPLAGLRYAVDTIREPRLGINTLETGQGLLVTAVSPGSAAAAAGLRPGDLLLGVGEIATADGDLTRRLAERYRNRAGAALPLRVRRGAETLTLDARVRMAERYVQRVEPLASPAPKARRIRAGILRGTVDR